MNENIKKEYKLCPDSELRFEIESRNKKVTLELKSGLAEIFGTELISNKKYEFFSGSSVAVITWQGCIIELVGAPDVSYVAKETPMVIYLNCHAVLERLRKLSERENEKGPVTMIIGACDVGKSTISRLLVNYAVRMKRRPIYVNLDVGQTDFGLPGTFGAVIPNKPACIEGGFSEEAPLVFHFGYSSPQCNQILYKLLITRLAEVCNERMNMNRNEKHSGIIINTCGWTKGEGYRVLIHIAHSFEVDAILVIDQQELYNDLLKDIPNFVKVILLPKSSGVVKRNETLRAKARNILIHKYFYGIPMSPFYPFRIELKFEDVCIYRIATSVFSSNVPAAKKYSNTTKLMPLLPIPTMKDHLLSVSLAKLNQDDIIQSNIAGFLHVQEVDMQKKILTVLSPQSQLMKNLVLLLSEVKYWNDS